ncbi:MAG: hypothetical protein ACYCOX_12300 [Acidobacteriaceae bacterium]
MNDFRELRSIIHKLHGGKATHLESVPVTEKHEGQIVWDGIVEVFRLKGHPQTDRIYAWSHDTGDPAHPKHYVTVLHIPPVISPQTAVKAAIVQEFRSLEPKKEN